MIHKQKQLIHRNSSYKHQTGLLAGSSQALTTTSNCTRIVCLATVLSVSALVHYETEICWCINHTNHFDTGALELELYCSVALAVLFWCSCQGLSITDSILIHSAPPSGNYLHHPLGSAQSRHSYLVTRPHIETDTLTKARQNLILITVLILLQAPLLRPAKMVPALPCYMDTGLILVWIHQGHANSYTFTDLTDLLQTFPKARQKHMLFTVLILLYALTKAWKTSFLVTWRQALYYYRYSHQGQAKSPSFIGLTL